MKVAEMGGRWLVESVLEYKSLEGVPNGFPQMASQLRPEGLRVSRGKRGMVQAGQGDKRDGH